jgi:hypothetical protein
MGRIDGKKVVALAVGATTVVVAVGQVYLPYIADRDKLRGLFEEEDMPLQARREMELIMQKERKEAMQQQSNGSKDTNAGSMWSNMRRN